MKIAVAGGTGVVGRHPVDAVLDGDAPAGVGGVGKGELELAHEFARRLVLVLDIDAVQRDLRPRRPSAVDRCRRPIDDAGNARLQPDQFNRVAPVKRQVGDLPLDDGL